MGWVRKLTGGVAALVLALAWSGAAAAQEGPEPKEGVDYTRLQTQVCMAPGEGTVEIVKVFSYTCIHCFRMAQTLEDWQQTLPEGITVKHLPVIWSESQEQLARLYWALHVQKLDNEETRLKIYRQIHDKKQPSSSPADIANLVRRAGLDEKKTMRAMRSFLVSARTKRSKTLTRSWKITGTPTLIVAGEYQVIGNRRNGLNRQGVMRVVKWLAEREISRGNTSSCPNQKS